MNIEQFYRNFVNDRKLAADYTSKIKNKTFIKQAIGLMNAHELELVRKLHNIHPMNGYYEVAYDLPKYPTLIGLSIILKGKTESGVIHTRAITELTRGIKNQSGKQNMEQAVVDRYDSAMVGREKKEDVNTLKLRITLRDAHIPIWREVIIPSNMNFYELHLVIQEAMGWHTYHLASFEDDVYDISVYSSFMDDDFSFNDDRVKLTASEISVHSLLTERDKISYIYDFGDYWIHDIEILEELCMEKVTVPYVSGHKGPIPIEDSGGTYGFQEKYAVIEDRSHPEHEEMLLWAKSNNYRVRYPKKIINESLKEMFSKGRPITEFNDPLMADGNAGDEIEGQDGIAKMVHDHFTEFSGQAYFNLNPTAEDYINANRKYSENIDEIIALAESMSQREIEVFARTILNHSEEEVYYCVGMPNDFETLGKSLIMIPYDDMTHARGVMHRDVANLLYYVVTSPDNDRHPGKIHARKYGLKEDLISYIDFSMTVEDIKFHLKSIGYRGYSKYRKSELMEKYAAIITSKEWVSKILETLHPVELLILYKKVTEDEFPFWTMEEPFRQLYENGLLLVGMYECFYMHPDVTATVRKIDMDVIIEGHIRSGRLKLD